MLDLLDFIFTYRYVIKGRTLNVENQKELYLFNGRSNYSRLYVN
ncbi:hypothetical protein SBF1_3050012 [Candidatus Desulfosporosinus infrequens]|uniref:Uncharacterized protein n=1 Tax=Candidatus Desulfosporosinus infrequens TaxID=2043169 RepID=A0A2U3KX75_9FIRM|nr:hypothetical protein SBF1_3050012 [Candidatus Desulfosporosinus infrequens]